MTPHLLLVRHARPRVDPGTPSSEWELSPEGRQAAGALAGRLAAFAPVRAIMSPEPKARRTASAVCGPLGLGPEADAGLAETRRRSVGVLSPEALEAGIARFFAEPDRLVFGEETADAAFDRFSAAVERHRPASGPMLVFSHGTVISLYVSRLSGVDPMSFWRSLQLPHALALGADGQVIDSVTL